MFKPQESPQDKLLGSQMREYLQALYNRTTARYPVKTVEINVAQNPFQLEWLLHILAGKANYDATILRQMDETQSNTQEMYEALTAENTIINIMLNTGNLQGSHWIACTIFNQTIYFHDSFNHLEADFINMMLHRYTEHMQLDDEYTSAFETFARLNNDASPDVINAQALALFPDIPPCPEVNDSAALEQIITCMDASYVGASHAWVEKKIRTIGLDIFDYEHTYLHLGAWSQQEAYIDDVIDIMIVDAKTQMQLYQHAKATNSQDGMEYLQQVDQHAEKDAMQQCINKMQWLEANRDSIYAFMDSRIAALQIRQEFLSQLKQRTNSEKQQIIHNRLTKNPRNLVEIGRRAQRCAKYFRESFNESLFTRLLTEYTLSSGDQFDIAHYKEHDHILSIGNGIIRQYHEEYQRLRTIFLNRDSALGDLQSLLPQVKRLHNAYPALSNRIKKILSITALDAWCPLQTSLISEDMDNHDVQTLLKKRFHNVRSSYRFVNLSTNQQSDSVSCGYHTVLNLWRATHHIQNGDAEYSWRFHYQTNFMPLQHSLQNYDMEQIEELYAQSDNYMIVDDIELLDTTYCLILALIFGVWLACIPMPMLGAAIYVVLFLSLYFAQHSQLFLAGDVPPAIKSATIRPHQLSTISQEKACTVDNQPIALEHSAKNS